MSSSGRCPVRIQKYLKSILGRELELTRITEAKSAQQEVLIVECGFPNSSITTAKPPPEWCEALQSGRNRLVLRIWKGSARWWNLNCNEPGDGVVCLARSEVAGYRMASRALHDTSLQIPAVLHFSHGSKYDNDMPWAVLSYVGPECVRFDETRTHCVEWSDGMVKIRSEFGFEEPHPRWGRVPEDQCLRYASCVLQEFVIPMHHYFFRRKEVLDWSDLGRTRNVGYYQYGDMVDLYQSAHSRMQNTDQPGAPKDGRVEKSIHVLETCIGRLRSGADTIPALPSVLCHMDCQPQNLIFSRTAETSLPNIESVLDWEEAAYADPRFEVLLLCRKVCANRPQALVLWDCYSDEMKKAHALDIGPIEPWLKLETVHSITTLLLQTLNLLDGGRNPWESQPDIWGKIAREFGRLARGGWEFCELDEL